MKDASGKVTYFFNNFGKRDVECRSHISPMNTVSMKCMIRMKIVKYCLIFFQNKAPSRGIGADQTKTSAQLT